MDLSNWSINQFLNFSYIMADSVCLIIFSIILYRNTHTGSKQIGDRIFNYVLLFHMLFFASEIVWAPSFFNLVDVHFMFKRACRAIKYSAVSLGTYAWFLFIEFYIHSSLINTKKKRLLFAIPADFSVLVSLVICLSFDKPQNVLDQNLMSAVMTFIPFMYMIYAIVHAFIKIFGHKEIINKKSKALFASYPITLIVAAVLQLIIDKISILSFATTINMLLIYLVSISDKVSKDPLTNLNNRNELNRYIYNNVKPNDDVYIVMMDVDNFKLINDNYGHVEGDKALIFVAKTLEKSLGEGSNRFLARYGGDEFIIILKDTTEEEIEELFKRINDRLINHNELSYEIVLSKGFAHMNHNEDFISSINRADQALYSVKKSHKNGRRK